MTGAGWVETRLATLAVSMLEPEVRGVLEGLDRRLHAGAVVDHHLDVLGLDQSLDPLRVSEGGHAGIGHQHHPLEAESLELPTRFAGGSSAVFHRRGLHREDRLLVGSHRSLLLLSVVLSLGSAYPPWTSNTPWPRSSALSTC